MVPGEPVEKPPEGGRAPLAHYRQLLSEVGFRPSRRLGQNFLLEPELHRVVADAVGPQPEDVVLEVGAGLGFLTRELAARCRVLAVEVDDRLCALLVRELGCHPNIRLLPVDALARSRLSPEVTEALAEELRECAGRFLVVANLPYAISGPLLAALVTMPSPPAAMALMVQLEFARRLTAAPACKDYGSLSVLVQLGYDARLLRRVSAEVFWPRPQVDSALVVLQQREDGILTQPAGERVELAHFLRQLFCARRKKLRNAGILRRAPGLADRVGGNVAADLLEQRPDAVLPAELSHLWQLWKSLDPASGGP
ncbi:MAG: 16S rRNA (adenine(1518)-N(6)/adenine(1519)-N(6))-dimethyltransferase RsmA [Planctomycetota bacterium]|jgi:16S rRNA (adenine1518-N6/adenine1519-N6)-dimethyltransferase